MIDARLMPHDQEAITAGEAVAGLILNGLGFAKKPLSLPPRFLANTPLDLLFREGVQAELFNRFTLGRTLDEGQAYGCDVLFSALARAVCDQEGIAPRFQHRDTTSFSLSGDSGPETDEQAIRITHGSSQDHRPDLQQTIVEIMVSQDGGVPMARKSWDGNASESQIFKERAEALMTTFASSEAPRYLVADAKLPSENSAVHLSKLGFITRIPATLKRVSQVITHALQGGSWSRLDAMTRSQPIALCHDGMAQRWLVVSSQAAIARAAKSVNTAQERACEALQQHLFHLQAQRCETPDAAHAALAALRTSWRSHQVATTDLIEHQGYAGQGRPTPRSPVKAMAWHMQAQGRVDAAVLEADKHHRACSVIGTHIAASQWSDGEIIRAYKAQSHAESGVRFRKDPLCFVSSLLVKKPSRIQGVLMVMT